VGRVIPQQEKSRMKFASNFGKYEEEWNEGDWKVNGEVPVMIILQDLSVKCATEDQTVG
jgi:hypothetical protein